jgi:hypothetical protein
VSPDLNERTRQLRSFLLQRYYKYASLGWFQPRSLHWAKIVTGDGRWKWIRSDRGIRGRILKFPPLHIYQTLLKFQSTEAPRGRETRGYLLGGPYVFETDLVDNDRPFSLWRLIDGCGMIEELSEVVSDRMGGRIERVIFSGYRGVHVTVSVPEQTELPLPLNGRIGPKLKSYQRERRLTARAIGHWSKGWDWEVSGDIWRVIRVPWSIHGSSALRAIPLRPPITPARMRTQLREASPFQMDKALRVRCTGNVPLFTFTDGESYGPFHKQWVTKVPVAVALHLSWLGMAKLAERWYSNPSSWFGNGWQILFRKNAPDAAMVSRLTGGGSKG